MDFNKSTCVALKSTYEDFKIYVPGSKDYVRGRRFALRRRDFSLCSSGIILVLLSWVSSGGVGFSS